jgi:hypothetical protein
MFLPPEINSAPIRATQLAALLRGAQTQVGQIGASPLEESWEVAAPLLTITSWDMRPKALTICDLPGW